MIGTLVSRLATIGTAGWVAVAEPFAPETNFALITALCFIVLADELDLVPSTTGDDL